MTARRALLAALAAASFAAAAQDAAPIRLLVGLAPGGANDIAARIVADKLKETLGRPVVVESRLGAGQRVALQELKRSAPDGRTLMLATNSPFTIFPNIYKKLDYDPVRDFTPIAGVMTFDTGLAVGPLISNAPNADFRQWLAWVKANPKQATYGTPGAGTLPNFLGVALAQALNLELTQVPYKGGSPAMTDLAGGQLPLLINGLSDMLEMHRAGKIRIVATAGDRRSPDVPDVPTLKELGIPVTTVVTVGIFGPPGMAPEQVARLNAAVTQAVSAPDTKEKFAKVGLAPWTASGAELAGVLAAESRRIEGLVKVAGIVPE